MGSQWLTDSAQDRLRAMLRLANEQHIATNALQLWRQLKKASPRTYMPSYNVFVGYIAGRTEPSYQVMCDLVHRWHMLGGSPAPLEEAPEFGAVVKYLAVAMHQASPAQRPTLRLVAWGVDRLLEELADCGRAVDPSLTPHTDVAAANMALDAVRRHTARKK